MNVTPEMNSPSDWPMRAFRPIRPYPVLILLTNPVCTITFLPILSRRNIDRHIWDNSSALGLPLLERAWCCEMSLTLLRYRLACSGIDDTNTGEATTATAISTTAAEEIIVNLLSVLFDLRWHLFGRLFPDSALLGGRFELGCEMVSVLF